MAADFPKTAELLATCGIQCSVAELHGVLAGQLSAGSGFDRDLGLKILALGDGTPEVVRNLLDLLAEDIRRQMQAGDFGFQPLLPDDDTDLGQRLDALSDWCDGFNAGFAGAWIRGDAAMAPETREVLGDFARIAQIDREDDDVSDKENEVNYMEVVEYARMAAITVYLQNNPAGATPGDIPEGEVH